MSVAILETEPARDPLANTAEMNVVDGSSAGADIDKRVFIFASAVHETNATNERTAWSFLLVLFRHRRWQGT